MHNKRGAADFTTQTQTQTGRNGPFIVAHFRNHEQRDVARGMARCCNEARPLKSRARANTRRTPPNAQPARLRWEHPPKHRSAARIEPSRDLTMMIYTRSVRCKTAWRASIHIGRSHRPLASAARIGRSHIFSDIGSLGSAGSPSLLLAAAAKGRGGRAARAQRAAEAHHRIRAARRLSFSESAVCVVVVVLRLPPPTLRHHGTSKRRPLQKHLVALSSVVPRPLSRLSACPPARGAQNDDTGDPPSSARASRAWRISPFGYDEIVAFDRPHYFLSATLRVVLSLALLKLAGCSLAGAAPAHRHARHAAARGGQVRPCGRGRGAMWVQCRRSGSAPHCGLVAGLGWF